MMKAKKILVPTDFSENSLAALAVAQLVGAQQGAEIHVLHIVSHTYHGGSLPSGRVQEREMARAQKRLERLLQERFAEALSLMPKVLSGEPYIEILEYADSETVDMIVMGTHGKTGLLEVLMGSVAEEVVRDAIVPVLAVKPYPVVAEGSKVVRRAEKIPWLTADEVAEELHLTRWN